MVYGLPCCLKVYVACRLYGLRCVVNQGLCCMPGLYMVYCAPCSKVYVLRVRVENHRMMMYLSLGFKRVLGLRYRIVYDDGFLRVRWFYDGSIQIKPGFTDQTHIDDTRTKKCLSKKSRTRMRAHMSQ